MSSILLMLLTLGTAAPKLAVAEVKRGQTLFGLATRHHTTVAHLKKLNGLSSTDVKVGQRLYLWKPAPKKPASGKQVAKAKGKLASPGKKQLAAVAKKKAAASRAKIQRAQQAKARKAAAKKQPSVSLTHRRLLGVPVVLVQVDLNDPRVLVTPVLPRQGLGNGVLLKTLAGQSPALAMINGGYFHPTSFIPAGDLVVQGRYIATGRVPTAVAITPDNRVAIHPVHGIEFAAWHGFETVIASGPHVLRGGQVARHFSYGYRDPAVFHRAARSALGIKNDRKLIFMSTRAKLSPTEVAKVMRAAGARDAILLDGGSSTGMAWKGNVVYAPARKLAYGIGVFANYAGRRYTR